MKHFLILFLLMITVAHAQTIEEYLAPLDASMTLDPSLNDASIFFENGLYTIINNGQLLEIHFETLQKYNDLFENLNFMLKFEDNFIVQINDMILVPQVESACISFGTRVCNLDTDSYYLTTRNNKLSVIALSTSYGELTNAQINIKHDEKVSIATSSLLEQFYTLGREILIIKDKIYSFVTKELDGSTQLTIGISQDFEEVDNSNFVDIHNIYEIEIEPLEGLWIEVDESLPIPICDEATLCTQYPEVRSDRSEMCYCTYINGEYGYRDKNNEWCITLNEGGSCSDDLICASATCLEGQIDQDCFYTPTEMDTPFNQCEGCSEIQMCGRDVQPLSCQNTVTIEQAGNCQYAMYSTCTENGFMLQLLNEEWLPQVAQEVIIDGTTFYTGKHDNVLVCSDTGIVSLESMPYQVQILDTQIVFDQDVCPGQGTLVIGVMQCDESICDEDATQDGGVQSLPVPTNGQCPEGFHYCAPPDYQYGQCGDQSHPEFRDKCWPIVYKDERIEANCDDAGGVLRQAWVDGPYASEEFFCPYEFYDGERRFLRNSEIYWFSCS